MTATWKALIHYPDGTNAVVVVVAGPVEGSLLAVLGEEPRWIVKESNIRTGVFEGQEYDYEAHTEAAAAE